MLDWLLPAAVEHGSTLQNSKGQSSKLDSTGYRRRRMNSRSRVLPTMKSYSPTFSQP